MLLEHIERIVAVHCEGLRADRDRALLLLGFWAALRGGELVALQVDDVSFVDHGMYVRLTRSKCDPLGKGVVVFVESVSTAALCPVRAVRRWLERVGQTQGPLLRAVTGERVRGTQLRQRAVSRIVAQLASRAAIRGDYSAHSLRAGFATSAYARGMSEREIQLHGRWKDRRSLDRYIQLGALTQRRSIAAALC